MSSETLQIWMGLCDRVFQLLLNSTARGLDTERSCTEKQAGWTSVEKDVVLLATGTWERILPICASLKTVFASFLFGFLYLRSATTYFASFKSHKRRFSTVWKGVTSHKWRAHKPTHEIFAINAYRNLITNSRSGELMSEPTAMERGEIAYATVGTVERYHICFLLRIITATTKRYLYTVRKEKLALDIDRKHTNISIAIHISISRIKTISENTVVDSVK